MEQIGFKILQNKTSKARSWPPHGMGALAPSSQWIPADDLLLKNAVEAGASLESLAKGAVCFSRRFTIRELQDRWSSLLYDIHTSEEASARIIEIEIELSASTHPKSNRTCSSKENDLTPGKRKGDSVRSHYYALRKRVCNEHSADLGFLVPPSDFYTGSYGGCGVQIKPHTGHMEEQSFQGAPISSHYGFPDIDFDIRQEASQEMLRVDSGATSADVAGQYFEKRHLNSLEDELSGGIVGRDYLYGSMENVPAMSVAKAVKKSVDGSFEHKSEHRDIPQFHGENLTAFQNSTVQGIRSEKTLPVRSLYQISDLERKPLSTIGSVNDNHGSLHSGFVGHQNLSSESMDFSSSFHHLEHSSPQPGVPFWGTIDGMSAPTMPTTEKFEDKEQGVSAPLMLHFDNVKKINSLRHDVAHSESKLHDGMYGAALSNLTTIFECDSLDLSFDLSMDEELFSIDSILLRSPGDVHQDDAHNSSDPKAAAVLDMCYVVLDGACPGESKDLNGQLHTGHVDGNTFCDSIVPDISSNIPHFSKPLEVFICCTLNTEDSEIPCNDDVLLPSQSINLDHNSEDTAFVSFSSKVIPDIGNPTMEGLKLVKEDLEMFAESLVSTLEIASPVSPEVGSMHPSDDCRVKAECLDRDFLAGASGNAGIAAADPNPCTSAPVGPLSAPVFALKEEITTLDLGKCGDFDNTIDSFLENPLEGSDHAKIYSLNIGDGFKPETDMPGILRRCVTSHAELDSGETGYSNPLQLTFTPDQEEEFSDSENDVPDFSDIEAMILDMDLCPYDRASRLFSREVCRYQYMDNEAIVRLEQGANSYRRRAIASHGAFAIFYGHQLKHYIKKTEVSLGRATEHVNVDIDLGREGCANNISRHQAIIKMNEDGSFFLKNTGKWSVLINSKEVLPGQHFNLISGCLIQIRGMSFIFEVNENSVRHYLAIVAEGEKSISKFKREM